MLLLTRKSRSNEDTTARPNQIVVIFSFSLRVRSSRFLGFSRPGRILASRTSLLLLKTTAQLLACSSLALFLIYNAF